MLILGGGAHRLSIDIDIMCPPGTNIEDYLKDYEQSGFFVISTYRTSSSR